MSCIVWKSGMAGLGCRQRRVEPGVEFIAVLLLYYIIACCWRFRYGDALGKRQK